MASRSPRVTKTVLSVNHHLLAATLRDLVHMPRYCIRFIRNNLTSQFQFSCLEAEGGPQRRIMERNQESGRENAERGVHTVCVSAGGFFLGYPQPCQVILWLEAE